MKSKGATITARKENETEKENQTKQYIAIKAPFHALPLSPSSSYHRRHLLLLLLLSSRVCTLPRNSTMRDLLSLFCSKSHQEDGCLDELKGGFGKSQKVSNDN